jgi:hypothetical protein
MKDHVSLETKLAIAREITAAFVRNEKNTPTAKDAAEMFKAIYATVEEVCPPDDASRTVGITA